MFSWKKKVNQEQLKLLAEQGREIREMLMRPGGKIVEDRLKRELDWVQHEWSLLLESNDVDIEWKRHELYAYLRALQVMQYLFMDLPKIGWKAEDKILAFAEREK